MGCIFLILGPYFASRTRNSTESAFMFWLGPCPRPFASSTHKYMYRMRFPRLLPIPTTLSTRIPRLLQIATTSLTPRPHFIQIATTWRLLLPSRQPNPPVSHSRSNCYCLAEAFPVAGCLRISYRLLRIGAQVAFAQEMLLLGCSLRVSYRLLVLGAQLTFS